MNRYRVLLLDDYPPGIPEAVDTVLAAELERTAVAVTLDAIRSPRSALRVIRENKHALDRYDAIIAITSPHSRRGTPTALEHAAATIAERLPVLLVQVDTPKGPRHRLDPAAVLPPSTSPQVQHLVLASGGSVRAAARQIAAALHLLLGHSAQNTLSARRTDAQDEKLLHRLLHITRLAREAFDLDAAAVNLIEDQFIATFAASGIEPMRVRLDDSFCAIALRRPGITVIPDTRQDPDAIRISRAHGLDAIRFYAAVPIHDHAGTRLGTLCLYDSQPHRETDLDFSLFHDLALLSEGELLDASA